jgi:hypothetical protein
MRRFPHESNRPSKGDGYEFTSDEEGDLRERSVIIYSVVLMMCNDQCNQLPFPTFISHELLSSTLQVSI